MMCHWCEKPIDDAEYYIRRWEASDGYCEQVYHSMCMLDMLESLRSVGAVLPDWRP